MRLIDAEPLHKALIDHIKRVEELGFSTTEARVLLFNVDNAPTIEAEPIIRCKDCKLNGTWDCPTNWNADEIMLMDDDDFCSYGDRKSEEASE